MNPDLDEIDGELIVVRELLSELKIFLDQLTAPDYNPADNPDDEFRDQDIEDSKAEQMKLWKAEANLLEKIKRRWPDLYHLYHPGAQL